MFNLIDRNTDIVDLVMAGAKIDGKIVHQAAFSKMGLPHARTFFFNQDIIGKTGKCLRSRALAKIESILNEGYNHEWMIRTESSNRLYGDSRIGLDSDQVIPELTSMLNPGKEPEHIVGIIQDLPTKSIERNYFSGIFKLCKDGDDFVYHMNGLYGIGSYLTRIGITDLTLKISHTAINKTNDLHNFCQSKTPIEIFNNFRFTLLRYGISALSSHYARMGMDKPAKLPRNRQKDCLKREFEWNPEELQRPALNSINQDEMKIILARIKECHEAVWVAAEIGVDLTRPSLLSSEIDLTSEELLIMVGAYYVSAHTDEFSHARFLLNRLSNNKIDDLGINYALLEQLFSSLKNVDMEVLLTHLFAFSIIRTPDQKDDYRIYFWDMPFDKEINLQEQITPTDINWVTDAKDLLELNLEGKEYIGLDLPIDSRAVDRLLDVLQTLKNKSQVTDIYVKYALLSHLSTLIRERGFNVISM